MDAELVHTIAPRAALTILLVKGTSLDSADQAVAASVAALRLGASEGGSSPLARPGRSAGSTASTTPSSPAERRAASRCRPPRDRRRGHGRLRRGGGAVRPDRRPLRRDQQQLHSEKGSRPRRLRPACPRRRGLDPRREPHDRRLDSRDLLGPSRRQPRYRLSGIGRRVQPPLPPALLPGRCPGYWLDARRPRRRRGRQPQPRHRASGRHGQYRRRLHDQRARRHERQRTDLGWDHRLADQYAGRHLGFVNPAIYRIARSPATPRPSTTSPPVTPTPRSSPTEQSPATEQAQAGTP